MQELKSALLFQQNRKLKFSAWARYFGELV